MRVRPNYCRSFREEAKKVWSDMSDAENFNTPRNEETTTEELLLSLARKHNGRGLEIKAHTKKEESKTGADWAIWFTDSSCLGIGARIQAKRLFAGSAAYNALYRQSKKQREACGATNLSVPNQCETLLSHRDGLVPLYVFYNSDRFPCAYTCSSHTQFAWQFAWRCQWNCPFQFEDWGISAASALAVKEANWGKNNKPGDFPMTPWHCLVCACCWDGLADVSSLPSLVGLRLSQLYGYNIDASMVRYTSPADLGFSFELTAPPEWVGLLRESREVEGLVQTSREEEGLLDKKMDSLNLKGVAIFEETEPPDG